MMRSRGRALLVLLALTGLGLIAAGGAFWFRGGPVTADSSLPTAEAREGEFLVIVPCRGELVAGKSMQVVAPLNVPNLQIVWMATPGAAIDHGEVMLRFDTSGAERQLKEKEAALSQSLAQLAEAVAQARITIEQNLLELSTLRTAAERARLETTKAETLSALQAEEKKIEYGLALEKVKVQEAQTGLVRAQSNSRIESLKSVAAKHQA
ncbi:MAG: membrane-fusion-like protein, partial [Bryobacteraceae bacterium]|nr:membrane-fusion-like protein [Bryobacteraceae bacterium]